MKTLPTLLALCLALAGPAFAQDAGPPDSDYVVICNIDDQIDDGMAIIVERAVKEAENAKAIVFVVDTPGGRVDSAIKITDHIIGAPCPTFAFVKGMGAISAGALISYSCDTIVMTPSANIGASTPVMPGAETTEAMDEKSNSFVRAKYRSLAEAKGHNSLLGEAMVDRNIEVRGLLQDDGTYLIYRVREGDVLDVSKSEEGDAIDAIFEALKEDLPESAAEGLEETVRKATGLEKAGEDAEGQAPPPALDVDITDEQMAKSKLISASGELLTLTANEAREFGLTPITLETLDTLLQYFELDKLERHEIIPRWDESLFAFLTSPMIAGLLLMAGLGGIYVEVRTPGFGLPGIVGVTCLAIFFGSNVVIGMADWVDLLLIVVGLVLIALEVFVLPGFGIFGALGILSCLAGFFMSLTRVVIPQYSWDFDRLDDALQTMSTAVIFGAILMFISWRYLPRSRFANWLVLESAMDSSQGYVSPVDEGVAVGMEGVATSGLRPSGRGRFEGHSFDIVSRGEFIDKGTPISIYKIEGSRIVVTAKKEES